MQNMTSMLMYVNVFSTDPNVDQNFLYNYATVNILNEIKRIPGVGRATILGNRAYAMRVELDLEPHARLQGRCRRRHEGARRTEHDRFARTTRPGDRHRRRKPSSTC